MSTPMPGDGEQWDPVPHPATGRVRRLLWRRTPVECQRPSEHPQPNLLQRRTTGPRAHHSHGFRANGDRDRLPNTSQPNQNPPPSQKGMGASLIPKIRHRSVAKHTTQHQREAARLLQHQVDPGTPRRTRGHRCNPRRHHMPRRHPQKYQGRYTRRGGR